MTTSYRLPSHVHFCCVGSAGILLNVKADRYYGVEPEDAQTLTECLTGQKTAFAQPERHFIDELLTHSMLLRSTEHTPPPNSLSVTRARNSLNNTYSSRLRPVTFQDLYRLGMSVVSCATVRWCGRRQRRLARMIRRVEIRNSRLKEARKSTSGSAPIDAHEANSARELVAVFEQMRSLLYSAHDRCLIDSFVLSEFLSRYNVFPNWVFGVTVRPFSAHCWLQLGDTVLNGSAELIGSYTPIMSV